ncbi:T-lymphocyte activation antigen CD80 isoform X2 [Coturnix japonica]|uniref:T-lymphocyte activation antigen CD80 isoform X2 n=1 Tax=Coturnix japonica TaxID=93934 RepID=UPI000777F5A8|nr:T-lymphocyte activation antigen CD80 isoform X2 [Coturnix japonica]
MYWGAVCLPLAPGSIQSISSGPPGTGCAQEKKVVKSKVGEEVSLPCCYKIPSSESLQNYRVYWQMNITDVVLAYSGGKKIDEHLRYVNRTKLDFENLTLWISGVEILDSGTYQCVVQSLQSSPDKPGSHFLCVELVTLFVTADFSKPSIEREVTASSCESTEMVVRCSSHGGFPKPKIYGVLNNVSVVLNTTWESESSLSPYNVTGTLWLNVTKDLNFTCFAEYDGFLRSTSLLLAKANDCIVSSALPSYNVITASSIIIITFLLAVILAAKYLPRHACSHCSKNQASAGEDAKEIMSTPHSCKVTCEMSTL